LKLLRDDLGTEIDHAARLQQEARVAASVNHPNVIQVFSSGTDHGKFYLVMELVDRGSLDDLIEEKKRLPEELVLETGIQAAKGLRAAYAKGLIHRDVKPANILFADEHTAKIGDFGLAGVAAEASGGEIWGTPYYVAPERLNNEPEDFRSDIYSLGATLFHAIAGRAPIEGETNSAVTLLNLKMSPLELPTIAPEVSAGTASVLSRMIAPEPAKRFSSYDELVAALEKAERVLTGKDEVDPQRVKKMRRLIVAGALTAIAIAVATSYYFVQKSRQQARAAVASASKTANAIPMSELERQFNDARKQLLTGKHHVAHAAFARIAIDAKNRQPIYNWVRLHEGLSALIARDPAPARQAFQEIEKAGQNGFGRDDVDLAKFFVTTAKTMLAPGIIPAGNAVLRADNHEAFALFLFALKDIAQLDVNDAVALLERFVSAQPGGKFAWIAEYKPLAQKYLDDSRLYATWKNNPKGEGNAAEMAELRKKLKTRSAISEDVSAAEKRLPAAQKKQEPARAPEQNKQAAPKKAELLAQWKSKLIDDLNRTHFTGAITDAAGARYTGIESATPQAVALKTPYGIVQAPWSKLSAPTQLAIATSFIKPGAADAADRQWLCAIFASETGQAEQAKQLAEAAAKIKPQYQEQMSLLSSPATTAP
jgi:hypothetical protein